MWTRRLKIAACVLCFCALMVGVGKGLRYVLQDDTKAYSRLTLHELYEQENIDVLFVGSSHPMTGIDPAILDQELQKNTFNAGTSLQGVDSSLMLIKEAAKQNELEQVFLDVAFWLGFDTRKERDELTQVYEISDYLKPSMEKYAYLLRASKPEHYANSFVVARRNPILLLDLDYLKSIYLIKNEEEYRDYAYLEMQNERYAGKGFRAYTQAVENEDFFKLFSNHAKGGATIRIDELSPDWKATLEEIIAFCEKEKIRLTLFSIPMSDFLLQSKGNYDEYIDYIKAFAQERNVDYYDFNLCKRAYFSGRSELFKDMDHLNQDGAAVFSRLLGRFINGELSPDELFYDSYADKLSHMPLTVFGVNYDEQQLSDGTTVRDCRVVASAPDKLECEITIEQDGEAPLLLQPYARSTSFQLAADEQGTCVIRYRSIDDPATEYETRLRIP